MDITLNFFEAFGIEPRYKFIRAERKEPCKEDCETYKKYYNSCYGCSMNFENISLEWLNKNYSKFEAKEKEDLYYPPITSDIVLGLSKILIDFGWLHCEKFTIDKYLTEFDNDELKDKIQVVEHNFEDCILKTCVQLKDKISEQVKALFKC